MSTSGQKRIESTIDTAIDCDEDEVMELAMQAGELLLESVYFDELYTGNSW